MSTCQIHVRPMILLIVAKEESDMVEIDVWQVLFLGSMLAPHDTDPEKAQLHQYTK